MHIVMLANMYMLTTRFAQKSKYPKVVINWWQIAIPLQRQNTIRYEMLF